MASSPSAGDRAPPPANDGGHRLPFARGGPLFVPYFIGPMSSATEFRSYVLNEIEGLKWQLEFCFADDELADELSVEELKVITEEELVQIALKGFDMGVPGTADLAQDKQDSDGRLLAVSTPNEDNASSLCSPVDIEDSTMPTSVNNHQVVPSGVRPKQKGKRKRGRRFDRETRAKELEGAYLAKVRELAEFKKKQDEDKLAARLHALSGAGMMQTAKTIDSTRSLRFISSHFEVKASHSFESQPVNSSEVVLCVEIYDKDSFSEKNQEFLLLGSQNLTDLRDNIHCLTDKMMNLAGTYDTSSYMLIEDTFYVDTRDSSCIDYTIPIFSWLQNNKDEVKEKWEIIMAGSSTKRHKELFGEVNVSDVPEFKYADMQNIRFCDVQFRLGSGYLLCHQGSCKHKIVIRDMRLLHPEDRQNLTDYPLLTFQRKTRHKKCSVCKIYQATQMTVDDKWAPKNPCYWCIKCYHLMHYKDDNTLLYGHTVFDYFDH